MEKITTSTITAFVLTVLCLFALPAQAQYNGGNGDPCDPYQINDPCQLNAIGLDPCDWDKHFILTADIDMADYSSYTTAVIAPDTDNTNYDFDGISFEGNFDGNDHVIRNLTINTLDAGNDYLGLFGEISGSSAEVKNLGLENINITGGNHSRYLGGLCGSNYYSDSISNCYTTGSVTGGVASYYLGGLCGENYNGRIVNCYTTGSVSGGRFSYYLGGLCGFNFRDSSISNCYSTGSVTGRYYSRYLGGLCGENHRSSISNCYSTGDVVTGGDYSECLGGLCGYNFNGSSISNCYATGSVSSGDWLGYLGGLVGYNYSSSISNSFWDIETGGPNNGIGTPKTTAEMQTQSTFTDAGWDFVGEDVNGTDDAWRMCVDGIDYPKLSWQFLAGDFLCPDGVDLADFAVLADTWSLSSPQTAYNDLCDLIDDNTIDLNDLAVFAENWLRK